MTTFLVGPKMRKAFEELKQLHNLDTDGDVLALAIGTQLHISKATTKGDSVYLANSNGENVRQLVFTGE